jgi:ATP-dependent DNA helicase RecQ
VRLLRYFGEESAACGNCDTCLDPPVSFDGTIAVQQLLSCIYRTGQRFGAMHVIAVLRGEPSDKVAQWEHDKLSTFGLGRDRSDQEWRAIIRQCIALGLLVVDHDAYSALKLTPACRPVLKGEQSVTLREWREAGKVRKAKRSGDITADLPADARDLYEQLRAWRGDAARRHGVPAYVVFHDATLKEIASRKPASTGALRGIAGIGARKLAAYGDDIIRLVAASAG